MSGTLLSFRGARWKLKGVENQSQFQGDCTLVEARGLKLQNRYRAPSFIMGIEEDSWAFR